MLVSKKVRPLIDVARHITRHSIDLGTIGRLLVDTPTGRLILVPKHLRGRMLVAPRLVIVRHTGKLMTLGQKGRFNTERYAKLLSKISDELKADVQLGDIDSTTRKFTTVFEEA